MILGKRSLTNLEGVHPDLVRVMKTAIEDSPIDFTITSGVRSTEDQQALYAQGRTKPGVIVTNTDGVNKKSNHQAKADGYGHAVDLYPCLDGKVEVNAVKELAVIASHILDTAKQLGVSVEWGGNWKTLKDYPHFELKA
jgi:peptidoglycan L-alanyl-D-glutamate endopeptidase CwlK